MCRDIDDFVDNFDFIMLIKCYGLKCSTFQSAIQLVQLVQWVRDGMVWTGMVRNGIWYGMVPCPLLSSAHHNSLVTISSEARRVGLPDFDNCLC